MNLTALCSFRSIQRETTIKTCLPARQVLRIMKLTAIILLAVCLQVSANGFSQKVTLSMKNAPLQKVFKEINRQTGFQFFYKDVLLKQAGKINIEVKDAAIDEVLKQCFSNLSVTYDIADKTIVVKERTELNNIVAELPPPPPLKITGVVKDEKGEPVAGASVTVKGTNSGTTTNESGYFELNNVNENATLVITATNIETVEVKVYGKTSFDIAVKIKVSSLDQIQIIGYGSTTKRLTTGAISTVKSDQINLRPVDNIFQALQGQVSGLAITNPGSGVGSPQQILIRGKNSITSGTVPLIILDGVIINQNLGDIKGSAFYQDGVSVLNSINPNDIKSIDILKDADATAIYGSRGTNGVIIITTKGAQVSDTRVSANVSAGVARAAGVVKRLNTEQYLQYRKDAFAVGNATDASAINPIVPSSFNAPDLTVWSQTAYTDYAKFEIDNPAYSYNADVSMVGGTKEFNFLTSISYAKKYDTYLFDPYQERYNGRMRFNHTSKNDKFKLSLNTILGVENQKFAQLNIGGAIPSSSTNAPNFELYKTDGTYNYPGGSGAISGAYYNPLPNENIDVFSKTKNTQLSGEMSYEFIKDLVGKAQVSYNSQGNDYKNVYPTSAINIQNQFNQVPEARFSTSLFQAINFEPQLTYTKRINKATIAALVGGTLLKQTSNATSTTVTNPGDDALLYNFGSGNPTVKSSGSSTTKFNSTFGRLSMDWDKKYLANLTYRRDGSSRFGPANRFGNFGSIGAAWIFTNEAWLKNFSALSFGKLRASYGTTGNNNIGDNGYLALLNSSGSGYQGNPQLSAANVANPSLQWEKTTKYDIGISLGFLKDRILLNATYFNSLSTNLLVQLPLTSQTGFATYAGNFDGEVENTGFEIDLTTNNLGPKNSVSWRTTFNLTHNKNQLKKYDGLAQSAYANSLQVGRALPYTLGRFSAVEFPYHFSGIDPANGVPIIEDVNKDGKVDTKDYLQNSAWIGSATPTTWGGMINSLSYKSFSLDVFLQFSNGIFTKWNYHVSNIGSILNPSEDIVGNYWMQPGDVSRYPRLVTGVAATGTGTKYVQAIDRYVNSDATLYKGYYVRLKNVRFSYNLPSKLLSKVKLLGVQFYISGENLAVYTPVKLYKDPESLWSQNPGVLRTITAGLQVSF